MPSSKFFIPGSVLRVKVANNQQSTMGMDTHTNIYFDKSPVFRIRPDAIADRSVEPLLWFDTAKPLLSGWAWGQSHLKDGVAAFQARMGEGKLVVFGPEIAHRAQTHGTFRLLFNQLYIDR